MRKKRNRYKQKHISKRSRAITLLTVSGILFLLAFGFFISAEFGRNAILKSFIFFLPLLPAAMFLHVMLHETGHLIGGLLQGYRFLSFRIFSLVISRKDGKFRISRFSLEGTGGQCLMSPPEGWMEHITGYDQKTETIPAGDPDGDTGPRLPDISLRKSGSGKFPEMSFRPERFFSFRRFCPEIREPGICLYLAGGVIMNVLITIFSASVMLTTGNLFITVLCWCLVSCGLYTSLLNGIPFRPAGIPNDIFNLRASRRDPFVRRFLLSQLEIGAMLEENRPVEEIRRRFPGLPDPEHPDLSDFYTVNILLNDAETEFEKGNLKKAERILNRIRFAGSGLPAVIMLEVRCALAAIYLLKGARKGDFTDFRKIFTPGTRKYAESSKYFMCDKYALLIAEEFLVKDRRRNALAMLTDMAAHISGYPNLNEVEDEMEFLHKEVFSLPSETVGHLRKELILP